MSENTTELLKRFILEVRKPVKVRKIERPAWMKPEDSNSVSGDQFIRLECTINGSNKYYSMELVGNKIITQYGRIGTYPPMVNKAYPTQALAFNDFERIKRSKLAKGYQIKIEKNPAKQQSDASSSMGNTIATEAIWKAYTYIDKGVMFSNILMIHPDTGDRIAWLQMGNYLFEIVFHKMNPYLWVLDVARSNVVRQDEGLNAKYIQHSINTMTLKGYKPFHYTHGSITDGVTIDFDGQVRTGNISYVFNEYLDLLKYDLLDPTLPLVSDTTISLAGNKASLRQLTGKILSSQAPGAKRIILN